MGAAAKEAPPAPVSSVHLTPPDEAVLASVTQTVIRWDRIAHCGVGFFAPFHTVFS